MTNENRQPKGQPTGGQFAPKSPTDADIDLVEIPGQYRKCAHCWLFVERNDDASDGIAEWIHLVNDENPEAVDADDSHEAKPSGESKSLLDWRFEGPEEMKRAFQIGHQQRIHAERDRLAQLEAEHGIGLRDVEIAEEIDRLRAIVALADDGVTVPGPHGAAALLDRDVPGWRDRQANPGQFEAELSESMADSVFELDDIGEDPNGGTVYTVFGTVVTGSGHNEPFILGD